jgi:hypothetical protein
VQTLSLEYLQASMAISSTSESDWASLPTDLLDLILHKLASPIDKVRFGAICKSWGTGVKETRHSNFHVAGSQQTQYKESAEFIQHHQLDNL